jgi:hypothetical protein
VIGIVLLTLVPGELGGSETYVRELLRGLGRVGELEYRVYLPPVAPEAAAEVPSETVRRRPRASGCWRCRRRRHAGAGSARVCAATSSTTR